MVEARIARKEASMADAVDAGDQTPGSSRVVSGHGCGRGESKYPRAAARVLSVGKVRLCGERRVHREKLVGRAAGLSGLHVEDRLEVRVRRGDAPAAFGARQTSLAIQRHRFSIAAFRAKTDDAVPPILEVVDAVGARQQLGASRVDPVVIVESK